MGQFTDAFIAYMDGYDFSKEYPPKEPEKTKAPVVRKIEPVGKQNFTPKLKLKKNGN